MEGVEQLIMEVVVQMIREVEEEDLLFMVILKLHQVQLKKVKEVLEEAQQIQIMWQEQMRVHQTLQREKDKELQMLLEKMAMF